MLLLYEIDDNDNPNSKICYELL